MFCSKKCNRGKKAELRKTWAYANGKAEYIPAALSRYETNLSIETTGWTAVAFVIPMNRTAAYIEPMALNKSCWVSLCKNESVKDSDGTDWHLDPIFFRKKWEIKTIMIHRIWCTMIKRKQCFVLHFWLVFWVFWHSIISSQSVYDRIRVWKALSNLRSTNPI